MSLVKIRRYKVKPGEIIVFTIGDRKQNIYPSYDDLVEWRKLITTAYGDIPAIVAPPLIKGRVLDKNHKHKVYLDNLEYLEYLSKKART